MSRALTTVLSGRSYLECPRWHDDRIWVVDFYTHEVLSAAEDGSDLRVEAMVPQQPSGLGWLPDGRLLVVSMRDRTLLRREESGELVVHADLAPYVTGHPNDMVVDAQGRAYVGNFGFDLMAGAPIDTATLVRVDPDGQVVVVAEDLDAQLLAARGRRPRHPRRRVGVPVRRLLLEMVWPQHLVGGRRRGRGEHQHRREQCDGRYPK